MPSNPGQLQPDEMREEEGDPSTCRTNPRRKRGPPVDHQAYDRDSKSKRRKTDTRDISFVGNSVSSGDEEGPAEEDPELRHLRQIIEALRRERLQQEEELNHLRHAMTKKEEEFQLAHRQHEERAKQLHELRKYTKPERSISGKELIELVDGLNNEIQQVAASIVDAANGKCAMKLSWAASAQAITMTIGDDTIDFLQNDPDGIFCQFALQGGMVVLCSRLIQEWSWDAEISKTLAQGYENLRRNNKQSPIAALWRTMSKTEWKYSSQKDYHKFTQGIRDELVTFVSSVLTLWKRFNDAGEAQYRSPNTTEKALSKVVELASELDQILGKEVRDEDWMVFALDGKKTWEKTKMEIVHPKSVPGPPKVLCAAGLGLQTLKLGSEAAGDWQVMTKAKVVRRWKSGGNVSKSRP
ncbi:hypothetical protein VNI00_013348 [Paramarasmius palmivorus]|uniref:Uncharacterized protein n=1 Tax=Paramarasmius palmivorus TaxID=297713 RepID=A0AAW0C1P8_9AGAR